MTERMRGLSIGLLAKAAGVTTPTVRFYEDIGLLPKAGRTPSGQRSYDPADVARVTFIRRCRDFGFSINEVRLLVGLSVSAEKDCREVRDIARAHLDEVRTRLDELKALERTLTGFVANCDHACAGGAGIECVIFKDLAAPAVCS